MGIRGESSAGREHPPFSNREMHFTFVFCPVNSMDCIRLNFPSDSLAHYLKDRITRSLSEHFLYGNGAQGNDGGKTVMPAKFRRFKPLM